MNEEIRIPLHFKEGVYPLSSLPAETEDDLVLCSDPSDILSYRVSKERNTVRLYSIPKQDILNYLTATYRSSGELYCVELRNGDDVLLVYLHFLDAEDAKAEVLDFAEQSASMIADELLCCREKVFRLFIENFYDGESFDYAAKIATESDRKTLIASAGDRADDPKFLRMLVNNSGNYPYDNRIPCDSHTIGIMLQCAPCPLYEFVVNEMTKRIRERVVPLLDKTDDFQFIASEYD